MNKIFDFIDRQRGKSEASRQRLAFGSALTLTALVAVVWFTAFNPFNASAPVVATETSTEVAPSPFVALFELGENFMGQIGSVWFSFSGNSDSQ